MKLVIDKNNLLSIEHPGIPQLKEYTYEVSGWKFSDWDKGMVVLHKKEFKIMNLKNLGDGMSVVYTLSLPTSPLRGGFTVIDNKSLKQAWGLFSGFDEVSGQVKYFFPGDASKRIGRLDPTPSPSPRMGGEMITKKEILSFLYGLTLLYGKFEVKGRDLLSIKIQVPLFGQYLAYQEDFDRLLGILFREGFFLKRDILETSTGVVYQVSCNDWEVLEIFAKWHQALESFEKITRKEFADEMKAHLLAFLVSDHQVPEAGREEVLEAIEKGMVKFLVKG